MSTHTVVAHLRFVLYRHGWPLLLGLVMLVAAVLLQQLGVARAELQAADMRRAQLVLQKQLAAPTAAPQLSAGPLDTLRLRLPDASSVLATVSRLHDGAREHQVELAKGEYRLTQDGRTRLLRYQITLPLRASYPQLRSWLASVMNAMPTLSLDELSLQRDDVGEARLDARVRLTLHLQAP